MSDNANSQWVVFVAVGIIGFVVIGGVVVLGGAWLFMSSSAPAPMAVSKKTSAVAVRLVIVEVHADPAMPHTAGELRIDGTTYKPDAAGYAAITARLAAMPAGTEVHIGYDNSIDAAAFDAVKKAVTDAGITTIHSGNDPTGAGAPAPAVR